MFIYTISKRMGEIFITTFITLLFVLVLAAIVTESRRGAAEAAIHSYEATAAMIAKVFATIMIPLAIVVLVIYFLFSRK